MVKQQLRKKDEIELFKSKYSDKNIYNIQKDNDLKEFIIDYVKEIFNEIEEIYNSNDMKNGKMIQKENFESFISYTSLSENIYDNKIKKARIYFFEEIEKELNKENSLINFVNFYFDIRKISMNKVNPKIILRNHIAENVYGDDNNIDNDFDNEKSNDINISKMELDKVLMIMMDPFSEENKFYCYNKLSPKYLRSKNILVSCSS
jgi:uncharacterized protein YdiU (UPF0061 family)